MRINITLIIILLSIFLLGYAGFEGIKIGNFQILSVSQIIEKNKQLDEKITAASTLTTKNYPDNIKTLEETYETYEIQKKKYEELVGNADSVDNDIYETKQYDIGYLWRVLGNYATKRNLKLGIEVQKNRTGISSYNMNFTVTGKYVNISQFITDIENDSDLYFRIYNFNMYGNEVTDANNNRDVQITSTFTVRNVYLDATTIS